MSTIDLLPYGILLSVAVVSMVFAPRNIVNHLWAILTFALGMVIILGEWFWPGVAYWIVVFFVGTHQNAPRDTKEPLWRLMGVTMVLLMAGNGLCNALEAVFDWYPYWIQYVTAGYMGWLYFKNRKLD